MNEIKFPKEKENPTKKITKPRYIGFLEYLYKPFFTTQVDFIKFSGVLFFSNKKCGLTIKYKPNNIKGIPINKFKGSKIKLKPLKMKKGIIQINIHKKK